MVRAKLATCLRASQAQAIMLYKFSRINHLFCLERLVIQVLGKKDILKILMAGKLTLDFIPDRIIWRLSQFRTFWSIFDQKSSPLVGTDFQPPASKTASKSASGFYKKYFWTLQDFKRLQLGARTKPIKGFLKKITHMTIGLRCKRSKARKSLASTQEGQTCRALAKNRIKVSFVALWKASFSWQYKPIVMCLYNTCHTSKISSRKVLASDKLVL